MKAVLSESYGPPEVLKIREIEKPVPGEGRVLVRVRAASINASDYRVREGRPVLVRLMTGGLFKPADPSVGSDVSGVVEAVGPGVTRLQPGDEVFGCATGSLAEFALARETNLVPKPDGVSFEQAAAVPVAALTALQGLRFAGGVRAGQKVLIQGASGGVGIFAVQLARHYGAEVTAVCSTRNVEMVRSLGAAHVIDYTKADFTAAGKEYDLIFAVNGYHSLADYRRALSPQGIYVCAGGTMAQIFQAMLFGSLYSQKGGRRLTSMGIANVNQDDLQTLSTLLESGAIVPVIDRTYPLDEVVAAFRYVEDTHVRGKVVITVASLVVDVIH